MADKKYDVEVIHIDTPMSMVKVRFHNGSEKLFKIVAPAKVEYAKLGMASISIVNDEITYLRSGESSFTPKPNFPKKQYNNSFSQGSDYKVEKRTKHLVVEGLSSEELNTLLDESSEYKEVFATNPFFYDTGIVENGKKIHKWSAVIYFKEK